MIWTELEAEVKVGMVEESGSVVQQISTGKVYEVEMRGGGCRKKKLGNDAAGVPNFMQDKDKNTTIRDKGWVGTG